MTICIGAICNKGRAAIVASDRMVTSNFPAIEFEHTQKKIVPLTKYCLISTAGNALKPIEIIPRLKTLVQEKLKTPNIEYIVENAGEIYQFIRSKEAESNHLKPRTITSELFYTRGTQIFPHDIFAVIDSRFHQHDLGIILLIVGIDSKGAHVFTIRNPGIFDCYNSIGFHAIGSGALHSLQTFISCRYKVEYDLTEALNIVYAAKKAAEVAPGVGLESDIYVINENDYYALDDKIISELERIYEDVHITPVEELKQKTDKLKEFLNKMKPTNELDEKKEEIKTNSSKSKPTKKKPD